MPTYSFQLLVLRPKKGVGLALPESDAAQRPAGAVAMPLRRSTDVLGASGDFDLRWIEPRTVRGLDEKGEVADMEIQLAREVFARVYADGALVFSCHLRRQYAKLLGCLWPHPESRPAFTEPTISLAGIIAGEDFDEAVRGSLSEVVIDHVKLEGVPSATVLLRTIRAHDLRNFIAGTQARVRSMSLIPRTAQVGEITITARGAISVTVDEVGESGALDIAIPALAKIGAFGGLDGG
jgi:hypothetical protein